MTSFKAIDKASQKVGEPHNASYLSSRRCEKLVTLLNPLVSYERIR